MRIWEDCEKWGVLWVQDSGLQIFWDFRGVFLSRYVLFQTALGQGSPYSLLNWWKRKFDTNLFAASVQHAMSTISIPRRGKGFRSLPFVPGTGCRIPGRADFVARPCNRSVGVKAGKANGWPPWGESDFGIKVKTDLKASREIRKET